MNIDISQHFKAVTKDEWIEAAFKSLKLDSSSELEHRLNYISCEGVSFKSVYSNDIEIELSSFPLKQTCSRFDERFHMISTLDMQRQKNSVLDIYALYLAVDKDISKLKTLLKKQYPSIPILLKSSILHNAGASITQELSFIYSLVKMLSYELDYSGSLYIEIAVDSLFFNNIAKLRALRFVLESLQEKQLLNGDFRIVSVNSKREQTLYDPWMNMLRASVNYSVGILGGADIICSSAYDELSSEICQKETSSLGDRQSVNAFRVLTQESLLGQVQDSSRGSYVIENLTKEYIELSFDQFKLWDKNGGILNSLNKLSLAVETISKKRKIRVETLEYTVSGINNYANIDEKLSVANQPDLFQIKKGLFPLRRMAEGFEQLRFKSENVKIRPLVLTYGAQEKLSARIMFSTNYLELLGHKCDIKVFDSSNVNSNDYSSYNLICLCAQDDKYEAFLKEFKLIDSIFLIAGNKFSSKNFRNIYDGQNVLSELNTVFDEIECLEQRNQGVRK